MLWSKGTEKMMFLKNFWIYKWWKIIVQLVKVLWMNTEKSLFPNWLKNKKLLIIFQWLEGTILDISQLSFIRKYLQLIVLIHFSPKWNGPNCLPYIIGGASNLASSTFFKYLALAFISFPDIGHKYLFWSNFREFNVVAL